MNKMILTSVTLVAIAVIFRRRLHQTTRFEGCCAVVY